MYIVDTEYHFIVHVHGILVITFPEILYFLVLERVHHLILTNARIFCPTYGINGTFEPPEKTFSINCTKENKKFCLSLHYKADNISLFINRKEFFKFKAHNKYVNFPTQFSAGNISNGFSASK